MIAEYLAFHMDCRNEEWLQFEVAAQILLFFPIIRSVPTQPETRKLQQVCCRLAIIKPISGCVRIACSGLMTTSLLQVVNRLDASCELQTCCKLRTADLLQIVNCRLAANCELQTCCKL